MLRPLNILKTVVAIAVFSILTPAATKTLVPYKRLVKNMLWSILIGWKWEAPSILR